MMRNALIAVILLLMVLLLPICSVQAEDADTTDKTIQSEDPFYIASISDRLFKRIYGKSFKEDCTLPREDLRYLHVVHVDLDGVEHEGEMIVNYHIAEDVLDGKIDYKIDDGMRCYTMNDIISLYMKLEDAGSRSQSGES